MRLYEGLFEAVRELNTARADFLTKTHTGAAADLLEKAQSAYDQAKHEVNSVVEWLRAQGHL